MATEVPGYKMTRLAGAAVNQYRFVKVNSDGNAIQVAAATEAGVGVAQAAAADGRATEVMVTGISKVEAGAVVTRGGLVTSDSVGRAVDAASTNVALGQALEAASAAGERIAVLLFTPGRSLAP